MIDRWCLLGCSSKVSPAGRIDDTAFEDILQLKVDARVMLIHNVDVTDSLTNGQLGSVSGFSYTSKGQIHAVLIRFDNVNAGKNLCLKHPKLASLFPGSVPIFRETFSYNLGTSTKHLARATLVQLPLRLAWGVTCHKVQGQTFTSSSKIVIHWGKGLPAGMVYVMLSRSKKLSHISIQGQYDQKQIRCDFSAKLMVEQLEMRSEAFPATGFLINSSALITVAFVNIQSLPTKIADIQADFLLRKANVLLFCETWLEDNCCEPSLLPNFVALSHVKNGRGQGLSSFVDKKTLANAINFPEFQKNKLLDHGCSLLHVYRSSRCNIGDFVAKLEENLTNDVAFLIGDFNKPNNKNIESVMSKYDFHQIVTSKTHRKGNKLDLCFVRFFKVEAILHPIYYSDHDSFVLNVIKRL